jgi:hypothetical protein
MCAHDMRVRGIQREPFLLLIIRVKAADTQVDIGGQAQAPVLDANAARPVEATQAPEEEAAGSEDVFL